jgi:hypothetical protein
LGRWQKPGDNAGIQKFTQDYSTVYNAYGHLQLSNAAISDASFIRLKNLSLSYQLPETWRQKMHIQGWRIFLQAQNLLTITRYLGLDPETQGLTLPPLRMITFGIHATL